MAAILLAAVAQGPDWLTPGVSRVASAVLAVAVLDASLSFESANDRAGILLFGAGAAGLTRWYCEGRQAKAAARTELARQAQLLENIQASEQRLLERLTRIERQGRAGSRVAGRKRTT